MMTKYRAQRTTLHAVYRKFWMFGNPCRMIQVAFPTATAAWKWIEDTVKNDHLYKTEDFMVEEFTGMMKAWKI